MLLTIDIGNSNIVLGAYPGHPPGPAGPDAAQGEGDAPVASWRLPTIRQCQPDVYRRSLRQLWEQSGFSANSFEDAVLCSVVGPLTDLWQRLLTEILHRQPLVLHPQLELGMILDVERPHRVGMDRLADAVAVRRRTSGAAVAVDFGTATTFNVVDAQGRFRGGAIAPGLGTITNALGQEAPALPTVELTPPASPIGRDTDEALRSGIVFGYAGLVEGLLARIRDELDAPISVIATGGLGHIITPLTNSINLYDPWLTLAGIRALYWLNRKREGTSHSSFLTPGSSR